MSGSRDAVLEVPLHLFARATIKSGAVDPTAQITWSFGDGSSGTGTAVEKLYRYAGTYLVTVDATDGAAKAHDEMIVTARPAAVRLFMASGDGITIANDANERLDLSLWRLLSETGSFRIPDGTVILPKTSALFPFAVTNLPITLDVTLLYPDGIIAARLSPFTAPAPATTTVASVPERQPSPASAGYKEVQAVESITRARTDVQQHEEAVLAPAATTELAAAGAALPALSVAASSTERKRALGIFRSPWTLGFLGVMMLAGGAFIFL
ncbi:PKD domain-containing protein [Candidatus Kaiserbacteria bacterium]|nr:PKD domain-containing protein [Candidatus Kaiserbacteria bacterium]